MSADQEARLARVLEVEPDADVQAGLENVARALTAFRANRGNAIGKSLDK